MTTTTSSSMEQQVSEEGSKKIRKPYTITKSRESWTEQEHDKFLEALQLFDRDWKKIEAFVGSKTVIQIRSHAQKYFLKVQKNGTGEHVPPPRPKRKSAQPYPQKAQKNGNVHILFVGFNSFCCIKPEAGDIGGISLTGGLNSSSSLSGSSPGGWSQHMLAANQVAQDSCIQATPDFAEVYKFIGSVFDPGVSGHLRMLKEMSPIDRETVLLLMRNLSINLSSPEFKEHGTGDNNSSVSAQAGTQPPLTPVLSPRSVESDRSQQRALILQPYTDSANEVQQLQQHSYDGGGPISPTFVGHGVSSSSPRGVEPASLVLNPSVAMQMHAPAMAVLEQKPSVAMQLHAPDVAVLEQKPNTVYALELPNLTTGVVGEGSGVDTWWN
ncbi:unnamed protein product [Sphagnum jensenii]|uniref:Uncharacterized protein n=1 Tax=Sphagnum jensenii TaxID=128206 RepID=A0ABP0X8P5_9BRYO